MTRTARAGALAAIGCLALTAWAGSLATSSAAGGSSASSAASSASESSNTSSNSSSAAGRQLTEGPYRIVEVAALTDRPGMVRLTLQAEQAAGDDGRFRVDLPQAALDRSGLTTGDTVSARNRPYGLELADAATERAFFLLLRDDWTRELPSNPVVL